MISIHATNINFWIESSGANEVFHSLNTGFDVCDRLDFWNGGLTAAYKSGIDAAVREVSSIFS